MAKPWLLEQLVWIAAPLESMGIRTTVRHLEEKTERLTTSQALQALSGVREPYKELFKYGSLSVELYKPEEVEPQEPNDQDEVYVVISGSLSW